MEKLTNLATLALNVHLSVLEDLTDNPRENEAEILQEIKDVSEVISATKSLLDDVENKELQDFITKVENLDRAIINHIESGYTSETLLDILNA